MSDLVEKVARAMWANEAQRSGTDYGLEGIHGSEAIGMNLIARAAEYVGWVRIFPGGA